MTSINLWNVTKVISKERFATLNVYTIQTKELKINYLNIYLKELVQKQLNPTK